MFSRRSFFRSALATVFAVPIAALAAWVDEPTLREPKSKKWFVYDTMVPLTRKPLPFDHSEKFGWPILWASEIKSGDLVTDVIKGCLIKAIIYFTQERVLA